MLLEGRLDEKQRDQAEIIATSGQALLTIINDILDFSKLEAGKLDLESVPMSPAATFEGVIELIESQASHKGLEIATFIAPGLAPVSLWATRDACGRLCLTSYPTLSNSHPRAPSLYPQISFMRTTGRQHAASR
jgi:signal transduction histidine kinase